MAFQRLIVFLDLIAFQASFRLIYERDGIGSEAIEDSAERVTQALAPAPVSGCPEYPTRTIRSTNIKQVFIQCNLSRTFWSQSITP